MILRTMLIPVEDLERFKRHVRCRVLVNERFEGVRPRYMVTVHCPQRSPEDRCCTMRFECS